MGQFYSKEFDGDPYIDLMRSLPERELVWWAQKVIWLAEGFTFVDHVARTYPRLFQHRCARCKGAGILTCPACAGTKKQIALGRGLAPVAAAAPGSAAAAVGGDRGGGGPCHVCGPGCNWDVEGQWGDKWAEWESRLAYLDKATGPLMDEWYEDVLNAGNLEEDTQPVEDEPPGPEVTGAWADDDRQLAKDKKMMAALMRRFGHPYDSDASLGYQIVDPTATMGENVWNMAQVYNYMPPELNPLRMSVAVGEGQQPGASRGATGAGGGKSTAAGKDKGGTAVGGAGAADGDGGKGRSVVEEGASRVEAAVLKGMQNYYQEIVMEAALMQNLQAASCDLPKPHRFIASAGTIPCGECGGSAWQYALVPNIERLFGVERPLWTDTLSRLERYWNPTTRGDPARTGHVLPYGEHGLRSLLAAEGGRNYLEELVGRAPESTARYRRELELLVANPEVRDARVRLAPGERLEDLVETGSGGEEAGRDLAAAATPLHLYDTASSSSPLIVGNSKQQQQQGDLALVHL